MPRRSYNPRRGRRRPNSHDGWSNALQRIAEEIAYEQARRSDDYRRPTRRTA